MKNQTLRKRFIKAGILIILLLIVDQLTKVMADIVLSDHTISVIGEFFQLDLAYNPGFAFSMGTGWPQWLMMAVKIVIPFVAAAFTLFRIKASDCSRLEALSLTLLTAGAFGNLIDRLFRGHVIDFLLFKTYGLFGFQYWPTFNVADILVVSGTIGYAITQLSAIANEQQMEKGKSKAEVLHGAQEEDGVSDIIEDGTPDMADDGIPDMPDDGALDITEEDAPETIPEATEERER